LSLTNILYDSVSLFVSVLGKNIVFNCVSIFVCFLFLVIHLLISSFSHRWQYFRIFFISVYRDHKTLYVCENIPLISLIFILFPFCVCSNWTYPFRTNIEMDLFVFFRVFAMGTDQDLEKIFIIIS